MISDYLLSESELLLGSIRSRRFLSDEPASEPTVLLYNHNPECVRVSLSMSSSLGLASLILCQSLILGADELCLCLHPSSEVDSSRTHPFTPVNYLSLSMVKVPLPFTSSQVSNLLRLSMGLFENRAPGYGLSGHRTTEAASHSMITLLTPIRCCVVTIVLYRACKEECGLWLMSVDCLSLGTSS